MRDKVPAWRARHVAKRDVLPDSMFFHLHGWPLSIKKHVKIGQRQRCQRQADSAGENYIRQLFEFALHVCAPGGLLMVDSVRDVFTLSRVAIVKNCKNVFYVLGLWVMKWVSVG